MKATINGIMVEGTPEEIAQYQRIMAEEARTFNSYPHTDWIDRTPWMREQWKLPPEITANITCHQIDYTVI